MKPSDFMKFSDFFYNGKKYRAVKFSAYRKTATGCEANTLEKNTYQLSNGYALNTVHYFEYEPLRWRILDPSTGHVMCESLVDAQAKLEDITPKQMDKITALYLQILPIMKQYNIDRSQIQHGKKY